METFKLWLEPDSEIPKFRRLAFKKTDVAIADVLLRGVHPWAGGDVHPHLKERFVEILNAEELKPPELAAQGYAADVTPASPCNAYYRSGGFCRNETPFEETLREIGENIYFVERLTYLELLALAKERLQRAWNHRVAHTLLNAVQPGFDAMRAFLKAKNKDIKLSGYADVDKYNLGEILSLKDFEGDDAVLIREGLPLTNFRSARFLERVTDGQGRLRLVSGIEEFQVTLPSGVAPFSGNVVYNCRRRGNEIRFRPDLHKEEAARAVVKSFAECWRTDAGRYCFTTDLRRLPEMMREDRCAITFPTLTYGGTERFLTSSTRVNDSRVARYEVGRFLTIGANGDAIREALRAHGVSMTGRKDELADKLAKLAVQLYKQRVPALDAYFAQQRFVKVEIGNPGQCRRFPVLEDCDQRNLVVAMYVLRHLRGNAILEASHENDTYDLLSLARALIRRDVTLTGSFLQVQ